MGLFQFFKDADQYILPDQAAAEKAGESGPKHTAYHRRIVAISALCGIVSAVAGIIVVGAGRDSHSEHVRPSYFILTPLLLGAAGLLFGVAIACVLAPREFLAGPMGQKWMKLIGTKSVPVARLVCLAVAVVLAAVPIVIAILENQK